MAKVKKGKADATGTDLFPVPKSPLGEAAEVFIDALIGVADAKQAVKEIGDKVIIELEKSGRSSLLITHGGDNYLFEVKKGEKKLRCVKKNRQPKKSDED